VIKKRCLRFVRLALQHSLKTRVKANMRASVPTLPTPPTFQRKIIRLWPHASQFSLFIQHNYFTHLSYTRIKVRACFPPTFRMENFRSFSYDLFLGKIRETFTRQNCSMFRRFNVHIERTVWKTQQLKCSLLSGPALKAILRVYFSVIFSFLVYQTVLAALSRCWHLVTLNEEPFLKSFVSCVRQFLIEG
jgi:hypothetical protein